MDWEINHFNMHIHASPKNIPSVYSCKHGFTGSIRELDVATLQLHIHGNSNVPHAQRQGISPAHMSQIRATGTYCVARIEIVDSGQTAISYW